jgi:ribosomal protein L37AE/L43A
VAAGPLLARSGPGSRRSRAARGRPGAGAERACCRAGRGRSTHAPTHSWQCRQVGWHAAKGAAPLPTERRKLSSTDVTRREGRTAATYFGHMSLLGCQ